MNKHVELLPGWPDLVLLGGYVTSGRNRIRSATPGGARVNLSAAGTTNPDGDAVSYELFYYSEAGTFPVASSRSGQPVPIQNFNQAQARFNVRVMSPGTMPSNTDPEL